MLVKTIFVIEDDNFFAQSFIQRLKKLGDFNIKHFEDVESAYVAAETDPPEILFLDHILKGVNGVDSISTWKSRFPKIEIAVITNNKDVKVLRKAIQAGATEFFLKDVLLTKNTEDFIAELNQRPAALRNFWSSFFDRN